MSKHNGKAKFATSISVLCLHRVIDYYVMSLAFGDHPSNHNCMYMREFDVSNKYLQQRILQYHIIYFYRLSIKMRKGNVLVMTVCQSVNYSVHEEGVLVQGPHPPLYRTLVPAPLCREPCTLSPSLPLGPALAPDMFELIDLDLIVQGPFPSPTCSNFFTDWGKASGWHSTEMPSFIFIRLQC